MDTDELLGFPMQNRTDQMKLADRMIDETSDLEPDPDNPFSRRLSNMRQASEQAFGSISAAQAAKLLILALESTEAIPEVGEALAFAVANTPQLRAVIEEVMADQQRAEAARAQSVVSGPADASDSFGSINPAKIGHVGPRSTIPLSIGGQKVRANGQYVSARSESVAPRRPGHVLESFKSVQPSLRKRARPQQTRKQERHTIQLDEIARDVPASGLLDEMTEHTPNE